jgi:hypothetical protein
MAPTGSSNGISVRIVTVRSTTKLALFSLTRRLRSGGDWSQFTRFSGLTRVSANSSKILFSRELQQIVPVTQATILVDNAHHLKAALSRLGLQFQMHRHGNRNAVERVFREVKRRTSSFSNTFSHVQPTTAEQWLQAFAVWWNHA